MGQKVNPIGYRLGVNKTWQSKWYSKDNYQEYLINDIKIREYLEKNLKEAAIASVIIEDIEKLRKKLSKLVGEEIFVNIVEEKNPDLNASLVAQNIASQIAARAPFRSAQKRAIRNVMKAGAKGCKTSVSGRLGGAEMARTEGYTEGTVPLHTIRADVDYAIAEADTTYGKIGVKVWIYKDEILPAKKNLKGADKHVDAKKN